jgi:hypothetical protein
VNNSANQTNGGAIFMSNPKSLLITKSTFESNFAQVKGGAVYYECEETTFNCTLEFKDRNTFSKNEANQSGGAIYWEQVEPKFNPRANQMFLGNSARVYANDIGCIPAKIV